MSDKKLLGTFGDNADVGFVKSAGNENIAGIKTFTSAPVISDASSIVAANDSVPGVVTTLAQVFSGKKTFEGGVALKGDTSGTGIASGYVGQVISSFVDPNVQPALDTWTQLASGFSIPSGNWLVFVRGTLGTTTGITKGSMGFGSGSSPDSETIVSAIKGSTLTSITFPISMKQFYVPAGPNLTIKVFMARGDSSYGDFSTYNYWAVGIA